MPFLGIAAVIFAVNTIFYIQLYLKLRKYSISQNRLVQWKTRLMGLLGEERILLDILTI